MSKCHLCGNENEDMDKHLVTKHPWYNPDERI